MFLPKFLPAARFLSILLVSIILVSWVRAEALTLSDFRKDFLRGEAVVVRGMIQAAEAAIPAGEVEARIGDRVVAKSTTTALESGKSAPFSLTFPSAAEGSGKHDVKIVFRSGDETVSKSFPMRLMTAPR